MKIWKIFVLMVFQIMATHIAEARVCFLPMAESCDVEFSGKFCSLCYSKEDGFNCEKGCATNSELCECTIIKCAAGYSAEKQDCPEGYEIQKKGKSAGRDCIKCIKQDCPENTDTNPDCDEGYQKAETEYRSGDNVCYKCVSDVCLEGTFKACPKNKKAFDSGETDYGTPCYVCEDIDTPMCEGEGEYSELDDCLDGISPQQECHKSGFCYVRRKICVVGSGVVSYEFNIKNESDGSRSLVATAKNCDKCQHTVGIIGYGGQERMDYGWACNHTTETSPVNASMMWLYIDVNGQITKQTSISDFSKIISSNWKGYVLQYSRSAHTYGSWSLQNAEDKAYYQAQVKFLDGDYKRYKIELNSIKDAQKFELIFNVSDFPLGKDDYNNDNTLPANKQCFEKDGYYASMESCMKPHQHKALQPYLYASMGGFEVYDKEGLKDFPQSELGTMYGGSFLGLYAKYPEQGDCFCSTNNIGSGAPLFGGNGYFALSDCCLDILEANITEAKQDADFVALFLAAKKEAWEDGFKKDTSGAYNDALGLRYKCVYHKASGCYVKIMNKEKECFDYKNAHFKFSCSNSEDKVVCQFHVDNSYSNYQESYLGVYRYDGKVKIYDENTKKTIEESMSGWSDVDKKLVVKGKGLKVLGCSVSRDDTPSVVRDDRNTHLLWETTDPNCELDKVLGENCSLK